MNYNQNKTTANTHSLGEEHQKSSKDNLSLDERKWLSQFPILRGFRVGGSVYVHCPWCDQIHVHG
jgi:hypothetical protein